MNLLMSIFGGDDKDGGGGVGVVVVVGSIDSRVDVDAAGSLLRVDSCTTDLKAMVMRICVMIGNITYILYTCTRKGKGKDKEEQQRSREVRGTTSASCIETCHNIFFFKTYIVGTI